jgi:dienelactone hydrolase
MALNQVVKLLHEGANLEGRIFLPEAAKAHAAVLVMPTAVGISEHELEHAQKLSDLGYVALIADMYGGGAYFADSKAAGPSIGALLNAPRTLRARVVAWYELLRSHTQVDATRVAAIGYCFGGKGVLELARSGADVKAVASFHGLLATAMPAEPGAIKGEVAIYTGVRDPYVPSEDLGALRAELTNAGARWQITEYGDANHAFTEPAASGYGRPGIAYNELAARTSWASALALLATTIG